MLKVFLLSEAKFCGRNEDAFETIPHPANPEILLVALADGQGGQSGGREAAQTAVQSLRTAAGKTSLARLLLPEVWKDLVYEADQTVARNREAGFTTVVSLCATCDRIVGTSCGDSAALLIQSSGKSRMLTEGQCKNPPIGSGEARAIAFSAETVSNWKVLVMSDGVWKFVGWERILEQATRCGGNLLIEKLRADAAGNSGSLPDDFTLVLIEHQL